HRFSGHFLIKQSRKLIKNNFAVQHNSFPQILQGRQVIVSQMLYFQMNIPFIITRDAHAPGTEKATLSDCF
ncbi:MAG TPA: hypothetical protein PKU74_03390, partial [Candidatus Omnitrophota bacterium]|nr:hypothetical protein [Candidatus Omnitrophota bacterium]